MASRLDTTNPDLAEQIYSASFPDAKARVLSILVESHLALPANVAQLLLEGFEHHWPDAIQDQIDKLDDRYFNLENEHQTEDASASFTVARFLAAVMLWQNANNHDDLCEAAYEASFAVEHN